MQIIKNKKIFLKKNLQIIFGHYTRLRGIAQTVWSCPTLPGSLQWVSGAHQLRSAEQRSAVRLIPTQAIVQLQFLVIAGLCCSQQPTVKPPKPELGTQKEDGRERPQEGGFHLRVQRHWHWWKSGFEKLVSEDVGLQLVTFVPRSRWRNTRGMCASSSMWRPSEERRT